MDLFYIAKIQVDNGQTLSPRSLLFLEPRTVPLTLLNTLYNRLILTFYRIISVWFYASFELFPRLLYAVRKSWMSFLHFSDDFSRTVPNSCSLVFVRMRGVSNDSSLTIYHTISSHTSSSRHCDVRPTLFFLFLLDIFFSTLSLLSSSSLELFCIFSMSPIVPCCCCNYVFRYLSL